jgi:hypothetical protein
VVYGVRSLQHEDDDGDEWEASEEVVLLSPESAFSRMPLHVSDPGWKLKHMQLFQRGCRSSATAWEDVLLNAG